MINILTTTDCIKAAEILLEEAKTIKNTEQHAAWWDRKVDVLKVINNSLETGYFQDEAYNELWTAKHILGRAEVLAGRYSQE